MENILSKFKKQGFFSILACLSGITLFKYSNITKDLFLTNSHPTKEYAEMLIKLDNRITNFCGYNYKINGFKIIENTDKYLSYRMNLNGIRGICKILVKVQKLDREELEFLSEQQKKISEMSYEARKREPFVPIDFRDILIPTKQSIENLSQRIENINNNLPDNLENFKLTDSLTKFNKRNEKSEENQILSLHKLAEDKTLLTTYQDAIQIKEKDSFFRFLNISVSYSDNAIFNIRPLNAKFRDYEIMETEFSDKTFLDVYNKISKIKSLYDYKNKYEVSAEELKNELKASKQNYFREKIESRSSLLKFQLFFMIGIIGMYRYYFNLVKPQSICKGVIENLSKNKFLQEKLGKNYIFPYVTYSYNPFKKNYKFKCVALNTDKIIIVKGASLPNADNVLPDIKFYDVNRNVLKI